ncbi:MAG: CPBP family intramembrane metalloprotease [Burkholderiales bacterium]|jgi:uncharacterized protein|nr:MAG: CPBP family intramembrane metalloprotease [Burkholderiales bacterium]
MPVPFVLLVCAIAAVWLPSVKLREGLAIPPWLVVYALALGAALVQGFVLPAGALSLVVLLALTELFRRPLGATVHWLVFALLLLLALALALHKVPGFNNPIVIDAAQLSPEASPFTQYLNFDKGSVGLVLVALLAPRLRRGDGAGRVLLRAWAYAMAAAIVVLGVAVAIGLVRVDPKWPVQAPLFLIVNLFLTCVAEEGFFRALIQDPLTGPGQSAKHRWRGRAVLGVAVSAALFGLAHAGAGASMVVMAALAGLANAVAYAWHRRIEVPIVMHFGVNAMHFLLFTYPALRH